MCELFTVNNLLKEADFSKGNQTKRKEECKTEDRSKGKWTRQIEEEEEEEEEEQQQQKQQKQQQS